MADILVVGSGASGVHFAVSALLRGHRVTMLDVGYAPKADPPAPDAGFRALKEELADPVEYFLGDRLDRVVYPGPVAKYFGMPPSKGYVFAPTPSFELSTSGFDPMISFARGGLAEAWTAGCYEMNDADLHDFPFSSGDLAPYYDEIARRIGVTGEKDDIARFAPFTATYMEPLPLDPHSQRLVSTYEHKRQELQRDFGFHLGRSRVATITSNHGDRSACSGLGRCLWGCPRRSIYAPSATLHECLASPSFRYVPGMEVQHLEYDTRGRVQAAVAADLVRGGRTRFEADLFVLAAGTLGSTRIYLASIRRQEGREYR